jgi:hypothetical protein
MISKRHPDHPRRYHPRRHDPSHNATPREEIVYAKSNLVEGKIYEIHEEARGKRKEESGRRKEEGGRRKERGGTRSAKHIEIADQDPRHTEQRESQRDRVHSFTHSAVYNPS